MPYTISVLKKEPSGIDISLSNSAFIIKDHSSFGISYYKSYAFINFNSILKGITSFSKIIFKG